ncbi:reticulocalbin-2 isoform X3 [Diaphorina citri]|nr:reticulocalbin-2 isoform X3 [Diaphorina citri]XP_026682208.1 reticulocalbin-2 isoform X3 [Diaphorina citri]
MFNKCLLLLSLFSTCINSAHIGSHLNKEREEDGSFVSRDHNHYGQGGEHNTDFDHEAILGSVKEAEEFEHLSPEESKKRLRLLLKNMDLNKDNNIDRKELQAWILRSFRMLSVEESNSRFEDADENTDGLVDWDEHLKETYGTEDADDIDVTNLGDDEMVKQDKMIFNAADGDKNGVLDKTEYQSFSAPEEHPHMFPILIKQVLEEKDTDKDGFLSFQEFMGDRGQKHNRQYIVEEKDKFDNEYDTNKDGLLNENEILSWIVPSNE